MESSYGIGVKNRYAIFIGEEEEDPIEIVSKTEDKLNQISSKDNRVVKALNDSKLSNANHQNIIKDKTQKDSILKSKPNEGIPKNKEIPSKGDPNRQIRPKNDRTPRNRDLNQTGDKTNHISDRQNRPPRPSNDQKEIDDLKNQRNRDDRFGNNEMRERFRSDSDRRGRANRGNGSRRGGGRFGEERRGKRDLDRHSGSDKAGVKAVDKREGGGAHNWGKISDFSGEETFAADTQDLADRSADETALDVNDSNQENDTNANEEPAKDTVEEPKEMTLEEYKQQLEEKRVQPKFNLRKPGEGEDNTQWKKTFVLKKKIEDEEEVEYEEIEVEETPKGRHKQFLDIEINFRDEGREFPRRGDGRRGGGRDRRGGDRGGDRGERTGDRGERGGDRGDRGGDRGDRGGDRGDRGGDRGDRGGDRGDRGGDRGDRGGDRGERPDRSDKGDRGGRDRAERPDKAGNRGARTERFGSDRPRRRPRDGKEQTAPKVDDWNDFPSLAAA